MTQEKAFFLRALSDHLAGRATDPPQGVDWREIARLARIHQLEPVLYVQCRAFLPEPDRFEQAYSAALYFYYNRTEALKNVAQAFCAAQIPVFPVKGLTVAEAYPEPALRTMGDCDLVVHPADMRAAIGVMRGLGFNGPEENPHEWGCDRHVLHFELHDRLVGGGEYATPAQAAFFNQYDPYVRDHTPDRSFHFLYLLIHLRKHFLNSGVGVRPVLDLAVLIRREPRLRWEWIEEQLRALDLLPFASACFALAARWFGAAPPIAFSPPAESTLAEAEERLLENGVFGASDAANEGNMAKNALIRAQRTRLFRRVRILWGNLFLPYAMMRRYPGCGYLNGRPYLLPAAWLHRLIRIACRKDRSIARKTLRESFIPRAELQAEREFLKKMGVDPAFCEKSD